MLERRVIAHTGCDWPQICYTDIPGRLSVLEHLKQRESTSRQTPLPLPPGVEVDLEKSARGSLLHIVHLLQPRAYSSRVEEKTLPDCRGLSLPETISYC